MARSHSSNTLKYISGSVAVVALAFCVGYFVIGGSRPQPTPPENLIPTSPPVAAVPAPAKPVLLARTPRTQNGEYTAPGAPSIRIAEDKTPSLVDLSKLQNKQTPDASKTPDPEASQEAAPTPKKSLNESADTVPPPDGNATTSGDTPPTPPAPDGATPPASPAAAPNDPDSEQVSPHPDSEAGQEGTGGKAQFRVQAGSFVAPDNAKALADALRRRGYDTSTHAERDGDKTVYKVQVGAYRNRAAANKAAQDLQSSGYPASVSPIGP